MEEITSPEQRQPSRSHIRQHLQNMQELRRELLDMIRAFQQEKRVGLDTEKRFYYKEKRLLYLEFEKVTRQKVLLTNTLLESQRQERERIRQEWERIHQERERILG